MKNSKLKRKNITAKCYLVAFLLFNLWVTAVQSQSTSFHLQLQVSPKNAGSVSGEGYYEAGSQVYVRAYTSSNYRFTGWKEGDNIISEDRYFYYPMPERSVTLTAQYEYDPGNPGEPNDPDTQNWALITLPQKGATGQTIPFPVYLLNTNTDVDAVSFEIQFPTDVNVHPELASLTSRRNGQVLTIDPAEGGENLFSVTVDGSSGNYFYETDGILLNIPVTLPMDWTIGTTYPVVITNAFVNTAVGQLSSKVRNGTLEVDREINYSVTANFLPDIYWNRVAFSSLSSGNVESYLWDFGDGNTSTEENPLHIYGQSGLYEVSLTVSNEYMSDTKSETITIVPENSWDITGTLSLDKNKKDAKNFRSLEEMLSFISPIQIKGEVVIQTASSQAFELVLTPETHTALFLLKENLISNKSTVIFRKDGSGNNPSLDFVFNGAPDTEYIATIIELGKYISLEDVTLTIAGQELDIEQIHRFTPQEVCSGTSSEEVNFTLAGGSFSYRWTLDQIPVSLSGYESAGTNVIPVMRLENTSSGAESLSYTISVELSGVSFYTFEYRINVLPVLRGTVEDLTPAMDEIIEGGTVNLSWRNVVGAVYDLYLWEMGTQMPDVAFVSDINTYRYQVRDFLERGKSYSWKIVAKNLCNSIESEILSFHVNPLPDLHVTSVSLSDAYAGGNLTVTWQVKNDGRGNTGSTAWKDYIWLVPDVYTGTENNATLLKAVPNVSALQSGEWYENAIEVALPERKSGNYYVLVTADMYSVSGIDWTPAGGEVPNPYSPDISGDPYPYLYASTSYYDNKVEEANETDSRSDNFFYKRIDITLPPLPDLQVTEIIPPDNFYSGQDITVRAQISNLGVANIVSKSWVDALYLSFTEDLNLENAIFLGSKSKNGTLNQDESYNVEFTCRIPLEYYGRAYFIVCTDINDRIFEHANSGNNATLSRAVNIILTPPADLSVTNIEIPSVLSTGSDFDLSAQIRNLGGGNPNVNRWRDRIFLSANETEIDESAIQIYNRTYSGQLAPGASYSIQANLNLPAIEEGEYYVYVHTDVNDEVFELDTKANNILRSRNTISVLKPDLTVEFEMAPETIYSGNMHAISWKLKNTGGAIKEKTISDRIFLSKNQNGSDPVSVAVISHSLSLNKGEERTLYENITFPYDSGLNGTYYLFVQADRENDLKEKNEENNLSAPREVMCVYVPKPDLTLANLSAVSRVVPGETVSLSYQVNNIGHADLTDQDYSLRVFLYKKSINENTAVECTVKSQTGNIKTIPAGGTVNVTQEIIIPENT
ncbi:MAG: PKD domain-containing protein [Bacteroidales bacterium]|nr:PKD domain-containing protein [Bacteroidales bacterium]